MAQENNSGNTTSPRIKASQKTTERRRRIREHTAGSVHGIHYDSSKDKGRDRESNITTESTFIPHGPPSPDNFGDETQLHESSSWHYLPLAFALIPPLGALIHGKSDVWSDILMLLLIGYYLYNLVKVPWELYTSARTKRILYPTLLEGDKDDFNPETVRLRKFAANELRRIEFFSLLFVFSSPVIGGYLLHSAGHFFSNYDRYMTKFNINLFVFTASIRPINHLIKLIKLRTLHLQQAVHYPSTEVELLKKRVAHLEIELASIQSSLPSRNDLETVKEGFQPHIAQLNKVVRRYEKKEQYLRMYSEERFAYLEQKLHEYDKAMAQRLQISGDHTKFSSHPQSTWFFQRGLFRFMFFPLNATVSVLNYILPSTQGQTGHHCLLHQKRKTLSAPPSDNESDSEFTDSTTKNNVLAPVQPRLAFSNGNPRKV